MTADLVAFLRERLDEDERAALDATQHRWLVSERRTPASPDSPYGDLFLVAADEGFGAPAFRFKDEHDARHIARHDPARVLAEIDAKRRILAEHPAHAPGWCSTCDVPGDVRGNVHGCPTLRLLALPYREHPDYQPEWAPEES